MSPGGRGQNDPAAIAEGKKCEMDCRFEPHIYRYELPFAFHQRIANRRAVGPAQGHDEEESDSLEVEAIVGKTVLTTFESAVEITAALSSLGFSESPA